MRLFLWNLPEGFVYENNNWYKINLTKDQTEIGLINDGQDVIIVIGEKLNKELIDRLIKE